MRAAFAFAIGISVAAAIVFASAPECIIPILTAIAQGR